MGIQVLSDSHLLKNPIRYTSYSFLAKFRYILEFQSLCVVITLHIRVYRNLYVMTACKVFFRKPPQNYLIIPESICKEPRGYQFSALSTLIY